LRVCEFMLAMFGRCKWYKCVERGESACMDGAGNKQAF
jgi:hypothetical protein